MVYEKIAQDYPAFSGYSFDSETNEYVIYVVHDSSGLPRSQRGLALGKIRQAVERFLVDNGEVTSTAEYGFRFEKVKYPFSDLYRWRINLREELGNGITTLSINERENKVSVGVDTVFMDSIISSQTLDNLSNLPAIRKHGLPEDAVEVSAQQTILTALVSDSIIPVRGGMGWTRAVTGNPCTVGMPVTYLGLPGFLTASHCGVDGVDDPRFTAHAGATVNGIRIGTEHTDPAKDSCLRNPLYGCTNSDVAFWQSPGSSFIDKGRVVRTLERYRGDKTIDSSLPYRNVVGGALGAPETTLVQSVGINGGWRTGRVLDNDFDHVSSNKTTYLNQITIAGESSTDITNCKGDSGGPWYIKNSDGSVRFLGIQSAGSVQLTYKPEPECFNIAVITPLRAIVGKFGNQLSYTR
ncbi:hypothetical protein [Deinococcus sp. SL84]|uniref:hypothetical protein n=1 Tax=Deinococcus sp. SL84 TaxID=2994663 RepID=UPI002275348A|nr:hypothetical protein [Deinococcus sp. SL84]MCY1703740.1 hypothetical protein [Deinococcus sp. SL84]